MDDDANRDLGPSPDDLAALARYAEGLADAVQAALPGWVERSVEQVHVARVLRRPPPDVREAAAHAGRATADDVGPRVRALLALDIDEQRTNPLALLRGAVRYPTEVLRAAGVPAVRRDEFAARQFPDDDYDLTPTSFAEIDPELHEPGLVWGAAKAHVHLARRRADGQR
jgi:uncharacterized protein (DUF2236 family)